LKHELLEVEDARRKKQMLEELEAEKKPRPS
jgi:hypothetical protein